MTQDRNKKRAVRALMAELGVSYTAALRVWQERRQQSPPKGAERRSDAPKEESS